MSNEVQYALIAVGEVLLTMKKEPIPASPAATPQRVERTQYHVCCIFDRYFLWFRLFVSFHAFHSKGL